MLRFGLAIAAGSAAYNGFHVIAAGLFIAALSAP